MKVGYVGGFWASNIGNSFYGNDISTTDLDAYSVYVFGGNNSFEFFSNSK